MSRRDREKRPARRGTPRHPLPRLLIVCEGAVTEPRYFRAFWEWCRNPRVQISIPRDRGVPYTLVSLARDMKDEAAARAKAERDENLAFDEVWCVYDTDEHPRLNDARQLAASKGIELAVSNPCFELWLLLHFRESPGARDRHEVQELLATFIRGYQKLPPMDALLPRYELAKERAARLGRDADQSGEAGRNPTTRVHRLTESIRGAGMDSGP